MADDPPVILPEEGQPSGAAGVWDDLLNTAIQTLETRINVLRQYVLDHPGATPDDADLAALIADANSATNDAIVALVQANTLALGTTAGTAAEGNHTHDGVYTTPAEVDAAISTAQSGWGTGIVGAPATWPTEFQPKTHTHLVTADLLRAPGTPLYANVVSLLTATSQQAMRAAMGAGTGDGTSNLQLGVTHTTAAYGDHTHGGLYVTATEVADMIAAALSGAGGADVAIIRYSSGAYPTRGGTSGVRFWAGPVAPTIGGSYAIPDVDWWIKAVV